MIKRPVVFVTRPLPQAALKAISKYATVRLRKTDSIIPRAELLAGAKQCDILLPILTDKIDDALLAQTPRLKLIANYGAGYNNVDVESATRRGIPVTNTPDVLTETTAELAVALMLAVSRRLVETDKVMRAGNYPGWGPLMYLGHGISGKTLGVIGMGRIGTRVAEIAHHGFGMHVLYYTKHKEREVELSLGARKVGLSTLLRKADVVTLHVPLIPQTKHLISRKQLALMKPSAYLINTSRGPVVDEAALVQALTKRRIAGAGLDVYEHEPAMAPGLAKLSNAVLLPHIGSATIDTRTAMAMVAAKNIIAFIQRRSLPNCVNPPRLVRSA
ncbi:MAG: D-glycerate dehydrogenase [Candidatus Kerfeldbacteria bacterium]|nr:D-glycerate dehydrogenase [Candidatus Kerfeldbacteria bacterium]